MGHLKFYDDPNSPGSIIVKLKHLKDEAKAVEDHTKIPGDPHFVYQQGDWGPLQHYGIGGSLPFALSSPHQFNNATELSDEDKKKFSKEYLSVTIQQLKANITYLDSQINALEKQKSEMEKSA